MDYGFISVLVSIGTLIVIMITIVKFWNDMRKGSILEGMRRQQLDDVKKDVNGIGSKVSQIGITVNETDKRVSNLEVEIKIKLEGIECALARLEKRFNGGSDR